MNILGISAFYHDSAACLVQDGRIVAAAQEERFTRKKHDHRFPQRAIDYCLEAGGIRAAQLDHVAFYDKPLLKFERLLETYLAFAPAGFRSFLQAMPLWVRQKLHLPREMDRGLKHGYQGRYVFTEHHESHAASAFFPSPFDEAAILTLDGVGEWATASYGMGRGNRIDITHEMHFPHSLGLLYTAFTYYCGFRANSGEYKLMGLAPYGEPSYKDLILEKIVDLKPDGSIRMDMAYFNYCQGLTMTSQKFHDLFGAPPRKPEARLTQREMDIAASIQAVTEEVMLRAARHVHTETGMKNLVLAGGVALNCVGNGRILREGPFENIWIQPAAGDAGGALGAALFVWHQLLDNSRKTKSIDAQSGSLLGPSFELDETRRMLDQIGAKYHYFENEDVIVDRIAEAIENQKVVGHMAGRMEFGPRALGCRSIIGDARSTEMQSVMNLKIKFRESFRPFAPCVLRDQVDEYFEMRPEEDSPYMLLVAPVREEKRVPLNGQAPAGLDKLKQIRSVVPAITHVDHSARVQTVDPERHPRMHRIMHCFRERTGSPVIINTSFNVRGEPIVCTPEDAYRCFMGTNMDVLVIDNFLLFKEEQPNARQHEIDEYLAQFELD
ncbi:MAG: carbamoyltransferase [Phycisphaerales bacterium]|nr:carbamoyltransferase [Phycisphaerales bacterium]